MSTPRPLSPKKLRAFLDPARISQADSTGISGKPNAKPPQPRALEALTLGLTIRDRGYNIYLAGDNNMGRTYLLRSFLEPVAAKENPPKDILYVSNFEDEDRPKALFLPAGKGSEFKRELAEVLADVRREIPLKSEADGFVKKRRDLSDGFQESKDELLRKMESEASARGFSLDVDDQGGMTLYPLVEGKLISEDEFDKLDSDYRKMLKTRSDKVMKQANAMLREIDQAEKDFREKEQGLEQSLVSEVLAEHLGPLAKRMAGEKGCDLAASFLDSLQADILDNLEHFMPERGGQQGAATLQDPFGLASGEDFFGRYEVNLFVDNKETLGAPIVVEDHPTVHNLLGCIERESEMGALVTDFTLIKSGSLHRACGGYLILHVEDLLQYPSAWEGLLRALRSGVSRIEDAGDGQEQTRTKTIEPEPLPMDVKVIIIGPDEVHEALITHDERFAKLFKIKAHLTQTVKRTPETIKRFLADLARVIMEAELPPFDREALAGLVDYSSHLAEDQKKLSLKMPKIRDLMLEAAAYASMAGKKVVDGKSLCRASKARDFRSNLYEQEFMEEYDRELIKVRTQGESVGRVNGLSVTWVGEYEFGLPHQIACTVGAGRGGIVDLEREAELGGPIHTKAMMILKSYLLGLFAQDKPLVLTGSLCFEQSYAHVEGDSASGAELAALLSAISGVPLRLSLAFTGAVSQSGAIMAVGGVTRKVEGFFEVCRRRGLTGDQGVILPADNVDQLMLNDDVVKAVEQGKFAVYPVTRMEQAMELLTGLKAGKPLKNGGFSKDSLYARVDTRLRELSRLASKADRGRAR